MTEAAIVPKIWNLANVMRYDGVRSILLEKIKMCKE